MSINQAIRDWIDPRWVTESELVDYLARIHGQSANPIPIQWSRRYKTFNVNDANGVTFTVPQSHYWVVDLVNATVGTGPAAANFTGAIRFMKPYTLTGSAGDLTYYGATTESYNGAVTIFYQIGGGSGYNASDLTQFIDMNPIMLEPGDQVNIYIFNAAALSSFYGTMWYWERAGV